MCLSRKSKQPSCVCRRNVMDHYTAINQVGTLSKSEPHLIKNKNKWYYGWNDRRNVCHNFWKLEVDDRVWRRKRRNNVNVRLTSLLNTFLKIFWEVVWSNGCLHLLSSSVGVIQACVKNSCPSLVSFALNQPLVWTQDQRIATVKLDWKSCHVKLALSKIFLLQCLGF